MGSRTAMVGGREVHVDAEGFLTEFDEWDEPLAEVLAGQLGIVLTPEHWKMIRFMRADYAERGQSASPRRMQAAGGFPIKQQFALFPQKPGKKMAYIAGLPKPVGCV